MRAQSGQLPLFPQGQTLVNAKAVLFIYDDQTQAVKLHAFLKQGMGANDNIGFATADGRQYCLPGFAFKLSGQELDITATGGKPDAEVAKMLFGQQFGGGHYRYLKTTGQRSQGGNCRYDGFAGADITLHQAQHGLRLAAVIFYFCNHSLLGGS